MISTHFAVPESHFAHIQKQEGTWNGVLLPKLFLPSVRKNCFSDLEKLLKFEAEGREFENFFEITRTIYSNSERSEQLLVKECFFNLFLEVSHI